MTEEAYSENIYNSRESYSGQKSWVDSFLKRKQVLKRVDRFIHIKKGHLPEEEIGWQMWRFL
jgi:hypothetical protein